MKFRTFARLSLALKEAEKNHDTVEVERLRNELKQAPASFRSLLDLNASEDDEPAPDPAEIEAARRWTMEKLGLSSSPRDPRTPYQRLHHDLQQTAQTLPDKLPVRIIPEPSVSKELAQVGRSLLQVLVPAAPLRPERPPHRFRPGDQVWLEFERVSLGDSFCAIFATEPLEEEARLISLVLPTKRRKKDDARIPGRTGPHPLYVGKATAPAGTKGLLILTSSDPRWLERVVSLEDAPNLAAVVLPWLDAVVAEVPDLRAALLTYEVEAPHGASR